MKPLLLVVDENDINEIFFFFRTKKRRKHFFRRDCAEISLSFFVLHATNKFGTKERYGNRDSEK